MRGRRRGAHVPACPAVPGRTWSGRRLGGACASASPPSKPLCPRATVRSFRAGRVAAPALAALAFGRGPARGRESEWPACAIALAPHRRTRKKTLRVDHVLVPWLLDEPVPARPHTPRTSFLCSIGIGRVFPVSFDRTPDELDRQLESWLRVSRRAIAISRAVAEDVARVLPAQAAKDPFHPARRDIAPHA